MLIELDSRRRATFSKLGSKEHHLYRAEESPDGTITLYPVRAFTEREIEMLSNPERVASVQAGVSQAHAGKVTPVDWSIFDVD